MTSFAALLILSLASVLPAQQKEAAPSAQNGVAVLPDTESVSDNIYKNDFFGFSYPFPAGWQVQSKRAQRQVMEEGHKIIFDEDPEKSVEHQEAVKLIWTLFGAVKDLKAGSLGPSIQIVAFDLKGDPTFRDPAEFLSGISETFKGMGGEVEQKPTANSIAGRKFFTIKMKIASEGNARGSHVVHWAAALVVENGYALVWFYFAEDEDTLQNLLSTLNQVQFSRKP